MMMLRWFAPWDFSLTTAIGIFCFAAFYYLGCQKIPVQLWRKICFWCGLFSIYAVLLTHFDYYAEHEFFIGRLQHAMLQHGGTFLMALSVPWLVLQTGWRVVAPHWSIERFSVLSFLWRFLLHPVLAIIVFDGLLMFWLIPDVHFVAMIDWRIYRVMNWSMIANGLMFWGLTLNPQYYNASTRIVMMLAVIPVQIVLGVLLVFSPHVLYPVYQICGMALNSLSPLQDQQIGGMIIWIHGAMMSVLGVLIVFWQEFRKRPYS